MSGSAEQKYQVGDFVHARFHLNENTHVEGFFSVIGVSVDDDGYIYTLNGPDAGDGELIPKDGCTFSVRESDIVKRLRRADAKSDAKATAGDVESRLAALEAEVEGRERYKSECAANGKDYESRLKHLEDHQDEHCDVINEIDEDVGKFEDKVNAGLTNVAQILRKFATRLERLEGGKVAGEGFTMASAANVDPDGASERAHDDAYGGKTSAPAQYDLTIESFRKHLHTTGLSQARIDELAPAHLSGKDGFIEAMNTVIRGGSGPFGVLSTIAKVVFANMGEDTSKIA